MSGVNNFPDGVAKGSLGFITNPKAPEELYPQLTGEDLGWVAGPGGAHGYQPITSTNPDGDVPGVSPMSPGVADMMAWPNGNGNCGNA